MKAWPHTHIGIARDDYGLFMGTRFLGSGKPTQNLRDELLQYYPEAEALIIFPLEAGTRWELEEFSEEVIEIVTTSEWVEGDNSGE